MNVFEDLIVELKEENLLEETVITANHQSKFAEVYDDEIIDRADEADAPLDEITDENFAIPLAAGGAEEVDVALIAIVDEGVAAVESVIPKTKRPKAGKEYFNKRAVDEMTGLQMVEHILTGVEREYMKVVPKPFDDFNAKKALNNFLNITENSQSEAHKAAEFALMQETEAWGLALIERDRKISVGNIRRYCENSRPALSSQAMLAIARFYRNAPYSEPVRSKFDFVITRLFSRPLGQDKRICLFDREQILGHINTLYSEWSSIPIYEADSDESNVMLTSLSFDDLAIEAENTGTFDQLIESDFFGRLRLFKESISELFYAPIVIAAAIESNVRIGNAYVKLIVRERQKMDAGSIQAKYGDFDGHSVSDAAGRTLDLAELLNNLTDEVMAAEESKVVSEVRVEAEKPDSDETKTEPKVVKEKRSLVKYLAASLLSINKWLLIAGFVGILISGGLYVASTYMFNDTVSTVGVQNVDLNNSILAEHIKIGKISGDTFYGLLLPSWDNLPKAKREEYIQKIYQLGPEKGYKSVLLTAKDGKSAGYANATKMEVYAP